MRKNTNIARAIRLVYKNKEFWRIMLEESEAQSGPFDGGCLICAKAIIRAAGGGTLVRLTSGLGNPEEHYGAKIDGGIYDFYGRHGSPKAWIKRFAEKESIVDRVFGYAEGLYSETEGFYEEAEGACYESEIPDDPWAEKKIASLLSAAMGEG